jgi:hypothetical protein
MSRVVKIGCCNAHCYCVEQHSSEVVEPCYLVPWQISRRTARTARVRSVRVKGSPEDTSETNKPSGSKITHTLTRITSPRDHVPSESSPMIRQNSQALTTEFCKALRCQEFPRNSGCAFHIEYKRHMISPRITHVSGAQVLISEYSEDSTTLYIPHRKR